MLAEGKRKVVSEEDELKAASGLNKTLIMEKIMRMIMINKTLIIKMMIMVMKMIMTIKTMTMTTMKLNSQA